MKRHGIQRDPKWRAFEKAHLKKYPACAFCGRTKGCVGHHITPVHVRKDLELDGRNILTLCSRCHILHGHLGTYRAWNPTVREEAILYRARVRNRPELPKAKRAA